MYIDRYRYILLLPSQVENHGALATASAAGTGYDSLCPPFLRQPTATVTLLLLLLLLPLTHCATSCNCPHVRLPSCYCPCPTHCASRSSANSSSCSAATVGLSFLRCRGTAWGALAVPTWPAVCRSARRFTAWARTCREVVVGS